MAALASEGKFFILSHQICLKCLSTSPQEVLLLIRMISHAAKPPWPLIDQDIWTFFSEKLMPNHLDCLGDS